jgi:hypothetical protein
MSLAEDLYDLWGIIFAEVLRDWGGRAVRAPFLIIPCNFLYN